MDTNPKIPIKSESSTLHKLYGLTKEERIHRKKIIDLLFDKTSASFVCYPLRIIYRILSEKETENQTENTAVLFSVSKRHFKQAVKRNHVKRQLREAYRLNKTELKSSCKETNNTLSMAILWLSDDLWETERIQSIMKKALSRVQEQIKAPNSKIH